MPSIAPADDSNLLVPKAGTSASAAANTPRPVQRPQNPQESWSSESSANAIISDSPSNYSSFSSSDSDEHLPGTASEEVDEDDALDVVGVSIGREQSRMKARATPAEEKNRVLEQQGGYFTNTNIPDELSEDGLFVSELTAEPESVEPEVTAADQVQHATRSDRPAASVERHATPHRPHRDYSAPLPAAVRDSKDSSASGSRSSFTRSLLKTSLPRRPRAWSGELKKFLPDLTSLTKRPSLPFRSANANNRARSQTVASGKQSQANLRACSLDQRRQEPSPTTNAPANDEDLGDDAQPISELRTLDGSSAVKHSFSRRPSAAMPGRPPSLRRSSSDQSLYLRASSTASSLEQRPRYENVHSQVNSRFKAIKDSLQDSSSRLLSMPSLHLQDIRTDWTSRPFPSVTNITAERGINGSAAHRTATPPPPPRYNTQSTHPILEEAMSELTGDVVILGGYRGSILRSAKAPHRQLWVPMKVGLNLRKVDLEVGLTREDEERMEETIIPSGVLSHVGPVDVCRRLMKRLRKCDNAVRGDLRIWDYGYDWRLSPDLLSQRLITFLEGLPCNRPAPDGQPQNPRRGATVIAHSLGGLITRHAVNKRPDLFAGVVYAGVPQHCVNILGPLRSGDDVLLSSRVLTAQVNFTFRTSFALLPEDGHCFIDKRTQEEYRVDFFNADNWDEYHLSPCIKPALPAAPVNTRFKDFALISKRFSMGPRDETLDLSPQAQPQDLPDTNDLTNENRSPHRTTPTNSHSLPNPAQVAATATDKVNDTLVPSGIDSLVGPGATPRSSTAANQATSPTTIPRAAAMEYLHRTLSEVKRFKSELSFQPTHQAENRYPPAAVLYGKSVPTLYGARVSSREAIKHQDAYDDLAFAAGDGVCLASAAMLPAGYRVIRNGLVKSDRGHVGLLGDLEGVGQCLRAVMRGRKEGVGLGSLQK
jgi:pimeloyl-ACP methyl ester carboxylesterase